MSALEDAASIKRLRKVYRKYASGGVITPEQDYGYTQAPGYTFTTPPITDPQPPAQVYADGGEVDGPFPRTRTTAKVIGDAVADYPSQLEMDRRRWLWDQAGKSTGERLRDGFGNLARVTADNLLPNSLADKAVAAGRMFRGDNYDAALDDERAKTRYARDYGLDPYLRPAASALGAIPWLSPTTGAAWTGLSAASNASEPSHSFTQWLRRVLPLQSIEDTGNTALDAAEGLDRDVREAVGFKSGGSTVTDVWRKVRDKFGAMQADRLAHAADE